jgi:hypothetical protein
MNKVTNLLKAALPIALGVAIGMWTYELSKKGVAKLTEKA